MKLTRRVLAVIVAVAMLVGVMAFGVYAATATSITTYGNYDAETNPYQAKIGLKVYRVDTETGEYTEITDGKVLNGEVIRVEVWGQTNYFASIANYIMAYSNSLFAPTKLDYSTYDYTDTAAAGLGKEVIDKVAYDEDALTAASEAEAENGFVPYETPYYFNTAAALNTAFAGADNYAALKSMYPAAWQGTGTAADNYLNSTGAAYNILSAGYGPDADLSLPASGITGMNKAVVMSEYQPLVYFNLTVDGEAGDTGVVTLPEAAVRSSSNASGRMYVSAGVPNDSYADFGIGVDETQAVDAFMLNFTQYKDTYEDGTVADRVVDLSEGTVNFTVVSSLEGGDEPDPEPVAPELTALGDTIIDEERGFIYGLPHGDIGGVVDLASEGYVAVEGDGSVVCTLVGDAEFLGTGATVELLDSKGSAVKTYTVIIFGDTDGNGLIETFDTLDLIDFIGWNDCVYDWEDSTIPQVFAMDINADGYADDLDVAYIEDYAGWNLDDILQTYEGQE